MQNTSLYTAYTRVCIVVQRSLEYNEYRERYVYICLCRTPSDDEEEEDSLRSPFGLRGNLEEEEEERQQSEDEGGEEEEEEEEETDNVRVCVCVCLGGVVLRNGVELIEELAVNS